MRLIDADALSEVMYHEAFEKDTPMQRWDSGCWIRYKMFENAIENAPTVVEFDGEITKVIVRGKEYVDPERKKGRWVKMSDADGIFYACSECGEWHEEISNYCPNCGAEMRGGRK